MRSNVVFCVNPVPPLSSVYNPKNQRQHYSSRNQHKTDIDPPRVSLQSGAMIPLYISECRPHEVTPSQICQEWTVLVQTIAYVNCCSHLGVKLWCHASLRATCSHCYNLTCVILPYLQLIRIMRRIVIHILLVSIYDTVFN